MSVSYAKIRKDIKLPVKESEDFNKESKNLPSEINHLFINTRYMVMDEKENIWVYSPLNDHFYLYHYKEEDVITMDCYPTAGAFVSNDCKVGLRLYKNHDASSEVLRIFKPYERIQATATFHVDEDDDIWVYVVCLDDMRNPTSFEDGWVIYKNRKNNFLNISYDLSINAVTTNGVLDEEKVKDLGGQIWFLDDTPKYFGHNFLQYFSDPKGAGINTLLGVVTVLSAATAAGQAIKKIRVKSVSESAYKISTSNRKERKTYGHTREEKYYDREDKKWKTRKVNKNVLNYDIKTHAPAVVQNKFSFPKNDGMENGAYTYDYYMDYTKDNIFGNFDDGKESLKRDMIKLYTDINLDVRSPEDIYQKNFTKYNRFKLPNPEDYLSKGFAHIFFTRPDCNVLTTEGKLQKKVRSNPNFDYAFCHRTQLVKNLTLTNKKHDFNLFLSNKAEEFTLTDESMEIGNVGTNYRKDQVVYGKGMGGKGNGEFSVKYTDTRELDVFHYHKLWTDYITNVYNGLWTPKKEYIWTKTMDYPVSLYYILTAEDGETIIFWSKYYGVIPMNIPSSSYSWSKGQPLQSPEVSVSYQYTMKEDFNPISLIEFNLNSGISDKEEVKFLKTYNENLGTTGYTWVGRPFIELYSQGEAVKDYYFKLRFKKPS